MALCQTPRLDVLGATNNPLKVQGLQANGVAVVGREAIVSEPRDENVHYLRTKKAKMGHEL